MGQLAEGERLLSASAALSSGARLPPGARALQAAIHAAHAERRLAGQSPWPVVLHLYNALQSLRDDPVIRVNRAVAVAEVHGPAAGLDALDAAATPGWLPFHAARADMLRRLDRPADAVAEYDAALALWPSPAETLFLQKRRAASLAR